MVMEVEIASAHHIKSPPHLFGAYHLPTRFQICDPVTPQVKMRRMTDSPPPPYSSSRSNGPRKSRDHSSPNQYAIKRRSQEDAAVQLQKYVVEILAYTLDADLAGLNAALCPKIGATSDTHSVTSILTPEERSELLTLSTAIQDFHQAFIRDGWVLTSDRNRYSLLNAVIDPARYHCCSSGAGYILDLISTYANHQCQPHKRNLTMLGRYVTLQPQFSRYYFSIMVKSLLWGTTCSDVSMSEYHGNMRPSRYSMKQLKETFWTYADIIDIFSPKEGVRLLLGHALLKTQAELGIEKLGDRKYTHWLPCEHAYQDISGKLKDWSSRR
jgi:hypothetical protein